MKTDTKKSAWGVFLFGFFFRMKVVQTKEATIPMMSAGTHHLRNHHAFAGRTHFKLYFFDCIELLWSAVVVPAL